MKDRDKDVRGRIRERTGGSMEETERDWMRRERGGKRERDWMRSVREGEKRQRERGSER